MVSSLLKLFNKFLQATFRDKIAISYSTIVLTLVILGYLASQFGALPYDPEDLDLDHILSPPLTSGHLLGTDYLGRDLFSRLVLGIDAYFFPGLMAVLIAIIGGVLVSVIGLFSHRKVSQIINFLNDLILIMPRLVLLLFVIAIFQPSIFVIMIIVGISNIPTVAQLLNAKIDLLQERSFIDSSIASGIPFYLIVIRHILWTSCRTILFAQAAFIMGEAVLMEASLSYLGFGTQEPTPSWGNMVQSGSNYLLQGDLWPSTFPALAIMLVISAFYVLSHTINRLVRQ